MSDKYHSDTQEKIETIHYQPDCKDTGDLEAATKTITATSKQGAADYSKSLTLLKPDDARMLIKRIGSRLEVTRDSGSSNNLYCSVYVDDADGSEADHCLFDGVDVQAASLNVQDVLEGTKEVIFDLLKDGESHTLYFFFWVDSGNSVISKVELLYGVGSTGTSHYTCLTISHCGLMMLGAHVGKTGSGTQYTDIHNVLSNYSYGNMILPQDTSTIHAMKDPGLFLTTEGASVRFWGTVATDILYVRDCQVMLRSER